MKDEIFKALADPVRRKILELLGEGDMAAGDISSHFNITKPSVSRHLAVLKASGLVERKKKRAENNLLARNGSRARDHALAL